MMGTHRTAGLLLALCLTFAAPAAAQEEGEAEAAPERPPEPVVEAAYEKELMRLSEVLGAVHFLRGLCAPSEKAIWRDRMAEIISAEKPTPEFEARLINRFNRGYESYALTYRTCTDSASLALDRYLNEGARLSREIADRYGT